MTKVYRTALFGLGKIAWAHMQGYRAAENTERIDVVAGADPNEEARQHFASRAGVERNYADYRELLEKEKPDIVSVCTWPPLHPEMVEAATAAGAKGILCEKPMSVDLGGADRMLSAVKNANAVMAIGHQRRLTPLYARAREWIEAGAIGELIQISVMCGGDLLTDGTHGVDLVRFLTGDAPAEWVIGNIDLRDRGDIDDAHQTFGLQEWNEKRTRYGHPVETGASAVIHFSTGVRGMVEAGICSRPGYQRMLVYGSEGQIEISGTGGKTTELRARIRGESDWITPELPNVNPFEREVSLLIDAMENGTLHPLDGSSGRATHEILMAVFESARQHARIDLPLTVSEHPILSMI